MNYCTNAYYPGRSYAGPILDQDATNSSADEQESEQKGSDVDNDNGGNFVTPEQAERIYG